MILMSPTRKGTSLRSPSCRSAASRTAEPKLNSGVLVNRLKNLIPTSWPKNFYGKEMEDALDWLENHPNIGRDAGI